MNEFDILDIYFRDHMYPFTKHHLDSYRQFLKNYIPNSIKTYNPITMLKLNEEANKEEIRVEVYIGGKDSKKLYLDRPTILDNEGKPMLLNPHDARLRNMTYTTKLYADVDIIYYKEGIEYTTKTFPYTLIGAIPLMLHSDSCILHGQGSAVLQGFNECPMDPGGYFVVDGKEKVIISQERITTNRLFISKLEDDQDYSYRAYIQCTGESGESSLIPRRVEFKIIKISCYENETKECYEKPVKEDFLKMQGAILVSLPSIQGNFPLATIFRALGVESDKEIIETICGPIEKVPVEFLNFLRPSLVHGANSGVFTMSEAHDRMIDRTYFKSIKQVKSILALELFPNIEGTIREKAMYLGYLISVLMKTALNINLPSDRDSYVFKRVDISGILLAELFQETYSKFRKFVRDKLDEQYNYGPWKNITPVRIEDIVRVDNLHRVIPSSIITDVFERSLKGMWGPVQEDPEQGKVQDLARISYIGFMSHLRRVNMPLDRTIKITSPHRLHSQQWGIMCPYETPDGASVGYLKNFAIMTQITSGTSPYLLIELLEDLDVIPLRNITHLKAAEKETIKVFLNGAWYGITEDPLNLVRTFRLYRRNGLINQFVSISWNINIKEIRIQTESGRPCRPLLIIENQEILFSKVATSSKEKLTWYDLLYGSLLKSEQKNDKKYYTEEYISPYSLPEFQGKDHDFILKSLEKSQGCIEYLDIEEENTLFIALNKNEISPFHTHAEIHPSTLFSIVTQIVPFLNHNQAPRVIFHAAQSKQAIGIYATNFRKRFDTMGYIQHYPQKRIISTAGSHYNGANQMPNGFNAIVAIATYTGFNQEDSVIVNKNAIERGFYNITAYKTMVATEKQLNQNERLEFTNPIELRNNGVAVNNIKHADYKLLGNNGIIKEESYIPKGKEAVIIGMVHVNTRDKEVKKGILIDKEKEEIYTDVSLRSDVHHYGKIDKVFMVDQTGGVKNSKNQLNRICKVRFRKVRKPELGDKNCLTPDHEVLTTSGWKYIDQITLKDDVYTLSEGEIVKIDKPTKLYEVECVDEEIYDLRSQQVDLCVTMDHNMYVKTRNSNKYQIIKAKDIIGKRVSYAKSAINSNEDYQLIIPATENENEKILNMEYFLEFFGFWISDGWARISKTQRNDRNSETTDYFVEIAQIKKEDRERLIEIIKILGYNPIEHNTCILISNKQLAEFLLPFSVGAPNKYLPEWVWKLSATQCQYLYNGLRRGDGTVTPKKCDIYYTSSKKLADDVQRLALHCGWSANIKLLYKAHEKTSYIKGRKITNNYDCLSVNIIKTKNNPTINHGHVHTQKGQTENIINYTGKVYCIEVPSHVFYVRKNGKPVWTGNCSSHGQKGVIGMILPQENMPFTKDGIVPDIIINPHAIPSRMTIGHLVETVFAKLCCMEGTTGDGTVFIPFDKEKMFDNLEKHNFEKYGNEILYNGRTGDQIKTEIFMGPIFYYRLKHMVADKMHSRDVGPRVQLTRQPTSGRSAGGGLRIGEMERDSLISHGLAQFIKESMMEKSDKYEWAVCKICGTAATYAPQRQIIECPRCKNQEVSVIETPYSLKLLIQELEAMNLQLRLAPENIEDEEYHSDNDDIDSEFEDTMETIEEDEEPTELEEVEQSGGSMPEFQNSVDEVALGDFSLIPASSEGDMASMNVSVDNNPFNFPGQALAPSTNIIGINDNYGLTGIAGDGNLISSTPSTPSTASTPSANIYPITPTRWEGINLGAGENEPKLIGDNSIIRLDGGIGSPLPTPINYGNGLPMQIETIPGSSPSPSLSPSPTTLMKGGSEIKTIDVSFGRKNALAEPKSGGGGNDEDNDEFNGGESEDDADFFT